MKLKSNIDFKTNLKLSFNNGNWGIKYWGNFKRATLLIKIIILIDNKIRVAFWCYSIDLQIYLILRFWFNCESLVRNLLDEYLILWWSFKIFW